MAYKGDGKLNMTIFGWKIAEKFTDDNENGDEGEFVDANENGKWDDGEKFTDVKKWKI